MLVPGKLVLLNFSTDYGEYFNMLQAELWDVDW